MLGVFDSELNREQLMKCLVSLMECFEEYQQSHQEVHQDEHEYRGYQILLSLFSDDEVNSVINGLHPSLIGHPFVLL